MQLFFTYETELPAGVGFAEYSLPHLCWLAACAVLSVLTVLLLHGKRPCYSRRLLLFFWAGALLLEVLQETVLAVQGNLNLNELPLHLCNLAPVLCGLHWLRNRSWLSQIVYALCLPGTLAALLFPGWTIYPAISFMSLDGFLMHLLILLYCVGAAASGTIRPRLSELWKVWLFLLIVIPPIYLFNLKYDTNYWFIHYPMDGSPLTAFYGKGIICYLSLFALLALAIMLILELPWAIYSLYKTNAKQSENGG